MYPEQANGDPIDHRSDLFSLGSVLYAMCTGRPPFRADSTFGVLRRIRETSPRSILEINGDIPAWMEGIVSTLLAKDQTERFATAAEVADVLEQYLAHVQQPTVVALPRAVVKRIEPPALPETPQSFAPKRNGPHTKRSVRWGLLAFVPVVGAALLMYWKNHPTQPSPNDSPGHSESQSVATDPATEWNAVQFAFDALETDLGPFEAEMQSALDDLETEFSPPLNSSSGDNP
jgi:serine/threonine protein kinase